MTECHCGKDGHALNSINCPVHAERVNGWVFAKRLSDALLKIRPLGGSELFVKRNGEYYADPDYCGAAIEQLHERLHEAWKETAKWRRAYNEARDLAGLAVSRPHQPTPETK